LYREDALAGDSRCAVDGADVEVIGWVDENTLTSKKKWTKQYSDHCMLYFEVSS